MVDYLIFCVYSDNLSLHKSIMEYLEFVEKLSTSIDVSRQSEVDNAIQASLSTAKAILEEQASEDEILGQPLTKVIADIQERIVGKMSPLSLSDIRTVLELYGSSFVDLGAEYAEEFATWFKERDPEIYAEWHKDVIAEHEKGNRIILEINLEADLGMDEAPAKPTDLLFDFTNNTLGGRVYDTCDELLLEFFSSCLKARLHFQKLLDRARG